MLNFERFCYKFQDVAEWFRVPRFRKSVVVREMYLLRIIAVVSQKAKKKKKVVLSLFLENRKHFILKETPTHKHKFLFLGRGA